MAKVFNMGEKHNASREQMETALKQECVPALRKQGFKGSFPDFYRDQNNFVSLVNFQFFSSGGSFCVNLGYIDPLRKNVFFQPDASIKKIKVSATKVTEQHRLGIQDEDCWYHFGKTSYEQFRADTMPVEDLAATCRALLTSEAEEWWQNKLQIHSKQVTN